MRSNGFSLLTSDLKFRLSVLNRVASDRHFELFQDAQPPNLPILRAWRRDEVATFPIDIWGFPLRSLKSLMCCDKLADLAAVLTGNNFLAAT